MCWNPGATAVDLESKMFTIIAAKRNIIYYTDTMLYSRCTYSYEISTNNVEVISALCVLCVTNTGRINFWSANVQPVQNVLSVQSTIV